MLHQPEQCLSALPRLSDQATLEDSHGKSISVALRHLHPAAYGGLLLAGQRPIALRASAAVMQSKLKLAERMQAKPDKQERGLSLALKSLFAGKGLRKACLELCCSLLEAASLCLPTSYEVQVKRALSLHGNSRCAGQAFSAACKQFDL